MFLVISLFVLLSFASVRLEDPSDKVGSVRLEDQSHRGSTSKPTEDELPEGLADLVDLYHEMPPILKEPANQGLGFLGNLVDIFSFMGRDDVEDDTPDLV